MLKPLPHRDGVAKLCADAIRASILTGELPLGSRLPPERTLADKLDVNRATVRIALRELEAGGLLRVRQGSGYEVRDYLASAGPELVGPLVALAGSSAAAAEILGEVLVVRRHLARAVLERLAERPLRRADVTTLHARIDAMEALVRAKSDIAALADADLAILSALLDATRSPVLRLFFNPASRVLAAVPELAAAMYAAPLENVAAWRALAHALSRGKLDVDAMVAALAARDDQTTSHLARSKKPRR